MTSILGFKLGNVDLATAASYLSIIGGPLAAAIPLGEGAANIIKQNIDNVKANAQSPGTGNPEGNSIDAQLQKIASSYNDFAKDSNHQYQIHIVSTSKNPGNPVVAVTAFLPEEISLDIQANYTAPFGEGMFDTSGGILNKVVRASGISGITQEMSVKIWESTEGINISIPITFIAGETIGGVDQDNILEPIMKLLSFCTPSKDKGNVFLTPPGPTISADFGQLLQGVSDAVKVAFNKNLDGVSQDDTKKLQSQTVSVTDKTIGEDLSTANVTGAGSRLIAASKELADKVIRYDSRIAVWIGDFLYFDNVVVNAVSQNYKMILDDNGRPMQATVQLTFTTMLSPTIQDLARIFKMPIPGAATTDKK